MEVDQCPSFFETGYNDWVKRRLKKMNYGEQTSYSKGDVVYYCSFWYKDSTSIFQNYLIEIKSKIINIKRDEFGLRYELEYLDNSGYNCGVRADCLKIAE